MGPPPPASQAPPPERGRTLGSPTVEAERARGFGGPSLQGSPTRSSAQRARERMFFAVGRTAVPTSSVRLDRVVRSVSASEQSDESGTYLAIPRPPSPSMPRPDSRPGTRHQPLNPANHRLSAPGPHRGSWGTYGAKRVVPRPEGPGEDGVLPGNRGCSGESPADARAASLEPTSSKDTVFCRRSVRVVRVRDPFSGRWPEGPEGAPKPGPHHQESSTRTKRTSPSSQSSPFRGRWPEGPEGAPKPGPHPQVPSTRIKRTSPFSQSSPFRGRCLRSGRRGPANPVPTPRSPPPE